MRGRVPTIGRNTSFEKFIIGDANDNTAPCLTNTSK